MPRPIAHQIAAMDGVPGHHVATALVAITQRAEQDRCAGSQMQVLDLVRAGDAGLDSEIAGPKFDALP